MICEYAKRRTRYRPHHCECRAPHVAILSSTVASTTHRFKAAPNLELSLISALPLDVVKDLPSLRSCLVSLFRKHYRLAGLPASIAGNRMLRMRRHSSAWYYRRHSGCHGAGAIGAWHKLVARDQIETPGTQCRVREHGAPNYFSKQLLKIHLVHICSPLYKIKDFQVAGA
jgi:hypothetical protein